jgi:hypothetical protein
VNFQPELGLGRGLDSPVFAWVALQERSNLGRPTVLWVIGAQALIVTAWDRGGRVRGVVGRSGRGAVKSRGGAICVAAATDPAHIGISKHRAKSRSHCFRGLPASSPTPSHRLWASRGGPCTPTGTAEVPEPPRCASSLSRRQVCGRHGLGQDGPETGCWRAPRFVPTRFGGSPRGQSRGPRARRPASPR